MIYLNEAARAFRRTGGDRRVRSRGRQDCAEFAKDCQTGHRTIESSGGERCWNYSTALRM